MDPTAPRPLSARDTLRTARTLIEEIRALASSAQPPPAALARAGALRAQVDAVLAALESPPYSAAIRKRLGRSRRHQAWRRKKSRVEQQTRREQDLKAAHRECDAWIEQEKARLKVLEEAKAKRREQQIIQSRMQAAAAKLAGKNSKGRPDEDAQKPSNQNAIVAIRRAWDAYIDWTEAPIDCPTGLVPQLDVLPPEGHGAWGMYAVKEFAS
eukprot:tig00020903_g15084.t1